MPSIVFEIVCKIRGILLNLSMLGNICTCKTFQIVLKCLVKVQLSPFEQELVKLLSRVNSDGQLNSDSDFDCFIF